MRLNASDIKDYDFDYSTSEICVVFVGAFRVEAYCIIGFTVTENKKLGDIKIEDKKEGYACVSDKHDSHIVYILPRAKGETDSCFDPKESDPYYLEKEVSDILMLGAARSLGITVSDLQTNLDETEDKENDALRHSLSTIDKFRESHSGKWLEDEMTTTSGKLLYDTDIREVEDYLRTNNGMRHISHTLHLSEEPLADRYRDRLQEFVDGLTPEEFGRFSSITDRIYRNLCLTDSLITRAVIKAYNTTVANRIRPVPEPINSSCHIVYRICKYKKGTDDLIERVGVADTFHDALVKLRKIKPESDTYLSILETLVDDRGEDIGSEIAYTNEFEHNE